MTMKLKKVGLDVGERRVGRLMRINGIKPVRTRKHEVTTNSNHSLGIVANVPDGNYTANAPNQKWVGDISNIWTAQGWLYLAVILDLRSRRVVGWAVSDRMKKDLAIQALDMAVRLRNPSKGCIFHSDRGSKYCAYDYQKRLQKYGLTPSMSGKANCYDNASVETFFKTIKAELIWRQCCPTRRQAEAAIFGYSNDLPAGIGTLYALELKRSARPTIILRTRNACHCAAIGRLSNGFAVPANSRVDIGIVHRCRAETDQDIVRSRHRDRHVRAQFQFIIAAMAGQQDPVHIGGDFHPACSSPNWFRYHF